MRGSIRQGTVVSVLTALAAVVLTASAVSGCGADEPAGPAGVSSVDVLAETSFLADIAQNVAGDRLRVESILPVGMDPHSFDPTPQDAATVSRADAVIVISPGFEPPIDRLISGAGSDDLLVIDCSASLAGADSDPHAWLDPNGVVAYVDNIRVGLTQVDPEGAETFVANAAAYQQRLRELDAYIAERVAVVPPARRLLVTNHESLGWFAERYGFTIVGTILPSTNTEAGPSAEGLAQLARAIKATGAPAVFLETGNSPDLAEQLARETGIRVVTDLYTHSLGPGVPTYIDMMKWNVDRILEALE